MDAMIFLNVSGLLYTILICCCFFFKKKIKSKENTIYGYLIIVTILESVTGIASYLCLKGNVLSIINVLLGKIYLISMISWTALFTVYVICISKRLDENKKNKFSKTILLLNLIFSFIILFSSLKFKTLETGGLYSYGVGVYASYLISTVYIIIMVVSAFSNVNNFSKKYIPLWFFIIFGTVVMIIQMFVPELFLIVPFEFFITSIMYHTIENPDMKMVEALQKAKDEADRANHAKTDFLSSMSHEIRTPLNAIVGFSDCVNNATTLDEAKENAKDIVNASKTLLEIVNGILDISKIESGKLELNCSSYDARSTFEELATLIEVKAKEKDIKFTYYIDPNVPKVLYGDYNNVKKIITNLLSNAVKYTDKGFIRYEISCVNTDDMCRLIVSVEDSGRGIKKEAVDQLFTKFQRLDEDKNTTIEGTGLGLAITKQLVDLMGGKIVVHTVYGSGSKFTAMIPQKISNEVIEVKPEVKKEVKVLKKDVNLTDVKILIVDDNNLNLKVASKLLERYNANNITTVNSGFECLDKISSGEKYDLIFMDDMMPKMSGAETFAKLKEMPGFITPVVALTANAISGMRENYLELGFDEYLAKPIEKEALIKVLNKVLEEKEETVANVTVVENEKIEKDEQSHEEYLRSNGVNVDKALELLGDMNMYEVTLKDFLSEIDSRWERIKGYKESGDLENYAIEVHSLKSDCKYLGFTKLANVSFLHELKSKDKDKEYVDKHFKDLEEAKNVAVKIMRNM